MVTENFTGASASGNDGDSNRVITLSNTELTSNDDFKVFVNGLRQVLTTQYTVSHQITGTEITFLSALFDEFIITVDYLTTQADNPNYCTSAQVFSFMQLGATSDPNFTGKTDFDANTNPTKTEVEDVINEMEDQIDRETMHAWRTTTVTKEPHHLGHPAYQLRDGSEIKLLHRNVKTLTAGTDELLVWDGNDFTDYLTTKTEGRNKDYWQNEQMGFIFIKTRPVYTPRTLGVKVTYRFGEAVVPNDIQRACKLLTAAEILQSDDRTVLLPEGTSNIPYSDKANKWIERAEKIINNNREVVAITT